MTRRELIGMSSGGVVALAVAGGAVLRGGGQEAPRGTFTVQHPDAQWRTLLTPASYAVLRHGETEKPFTSPLVGEHRNGLFTCAGCDRALFDSKTKFESGTGWPSFWQALPKAIIMRDDRSLASLRTEVLCADCGGHLGHVFNDGPKPTGLRYCMNGAALSFKAATA